MRASFFWLLKSLENSPEPGRLIHPMHGMNALAENEEDSNLMLLTAEGDVGAFSRLYIRYANMVYSIALNILGEPEEARDVQQQVFLNLYRKASLYSPEKGKPGAWLTTLTTNQSLSRLRQIKSHRSVRERYFLESTCQEDLKQTGGGYEWDELQLLHWAMAQLAPQEAEVIQLAYFGGLTHSEISTKLSLPLGSTKSRIRRTMVKLRSIMEGMIHASSLETAESSGGFWCQ